MSEVKSVSDFSDAGTAISSTQSTHSTQRSARRKLVSASVATAGAALLTAYVFTTLDADTTNILRALVHLAPAVSSRYAAVFWSSSQEALFSLMVVLAASSGAVLIGRLSTVPRCIGWLQLAVVMLLIGGLSANMSLNIHPLAILCAIIYGGACGYLLRHVGVQVQQQESRRFETLLRTRELQEARLQMVKQDEVDRRLLAGDLHDQVLNDLKILNQKFQTYRQEPSPESASEIDKLLHQAMNGVRDVMDSLSPAAIEHLGFAAAVEDCLRRAGERGNFKVRCKKDGELDQLERLDLIEQTLLFRLIQECGNNITKHARASVVKLQLSVADGAALLRVTDNGVGLPQDVDVNDSRGLQYMRQRGDLIGATIAWLPGEGGKGTCVEVRMPIKSKTND